MKPFRPVVKSLKTSIIKIETSSGISKEASLGLTIIPIGSDDLFVELPNLSKTYTYNIINTAEMLGNITLRTSGGASLKGLMLNTMGGALSITPLPQGTTSIEMSSDVKDGCFVQTLSNGLDWFIWSVAAHGSLGISQVGGSTGSGTGGGTGGGGGTPSGPQTPTGTVTTVVDPVLVDSIVPTTTFPAPSFEARHSLEISGRAQPNTTIAVSEDNGAIQTITGIPVDSNGNWGPITIPNLESGNYSFDFVDESSKPGTSALNQIFSDNTGALTFTTPSSFTVERGTSFDFTAGALALDPSGNPIVPFNIDDSQYTTSLAHGATFDVVYSFDYNGTPFTRTVSGVVEDTIAPAKPTITSATFDSVNINDFTATGAAEDGSTVEIFFDGVSQGTVTSIGGTWTFNSTFVFNQTFDITVQAVDDAGNVSEESDPTSAVYSPPTLARPTLTIVNAPTNTWTNQDNPIELTGTTDAGSTIVIKDGNVVVTPASGPTYNGNTWTATINVADESNSSLTAEASQAGFNSPSPSTTKTLLVDRVPPVISGTPLGDLTVYLGNIGANNDSIPAATDFTSVTVASNWTTQVDATEGAKTVTYTATDAAGNITTESRTVTVATQVIVPTNLVAIGGTEEATITGDVVGTYSNNLQVKIYVIDSNGLESVYQENGSDVLFGVVNGSFSATLALDAGDYTFSATTVNSIPEESSQSSDTSQVTVAGSSAPSATFPTLPSGGTATVDSEGVLAVPANNTTNLTITTDELYGETNPAFNNQIGFSLWFKWDGASPMSFNLFNCGNNKDQSIGVDSSGKISIQNFSSTSVVDLSEILNSTFGIDLYDGQWHHIYIGYSNNQSQTLAQNAGEYHVIVDATFESVGVAIQDYVNSEGLPVARNLGPSNITIASTHGAAISLHAIESIIDTPLSLKQVEWLYNSGNGRGVRSLEQASLQNTEDIPSSGLFMKSSLKTSAGVDSTSLTSVDPFAFEGSLDVLDAAFIPFTKFNFPEKAFSFWAKITERNQVIVELIQGREGNDTVWQKFKMSYSASDVLNVVFSRKSERFGSTNQVSGQDTTASIDFSLESLVDDNYHHFLVSFDSDGSTGNMRTFVDGSLVDTTSYSSTNTHMRVDLQDDPYIQLNYEVRMTDVEVWLGEFDETSVATIYSQGTGFVSEPQFNEWGDFAGVGLVRVGASGLDRVTGNNTNYANYGASWNQDIVVPTGLAEGDYFYVQAELRFLGAHNGYMMFYDPTIASRTGTDFTRDSGGIVSWLFAFNSYINYSNSNDHRWILKALNQNSTSQVSRYTSGRISTNNESLAGAPHRHLRDYEIRFTKEAGGTYAISMEVTSQFDGSVINLNGPTGVTLPSIMRMDVKGSQGDLGYSRANGSIEIESVNMNVTQVP